jgi:hypothetical protein
MAAAKAEPWHASFHFLFIFFGRLNLGAVAASMESWSNGAPMGSCCISRFPRRGCPLGVR